MGGRAELKDDGDGEFSRCPLQLDMPVGSSPWGYYGVTVGASVKFPS